MLKRTKRETTRRGINMGKDIMTSVSNRYVCSVLSEMRDYLGHCKNAKFTERKYDLMMTLIEESQTYVNRMEAAIYDHGDVLDKFKTYKKLTAAIRKKEAELRRLEESAKELNVKIYKKRKK